MVYIFPCYVARKRKRKDSKFNIDSIDTLFDEKIVVGFAAGLNDSQMTIHANLKIVRKNNGSKEWSCDFNGGRYQPFKGAYDTLSQVINHTGFDVPPESEIYKTNQEVYNKLNRISKFG